MRKQYPTYIVDRSRRHGERLPDDYVVCLDHKCSYVARAYALPKSRRAAQIAAMKEAGATFITKTFADSTTVVLEVVEFLHAPVARQDRVPLLLKKGLAAYLYGEVSAVGGGRRDYGEQIAALDEVLRLVDQQRERMIDLNGVGGYRRFAEALRGARDSVALLEKIVKQHD